jgi:hypothetical protein
MGDACNVWRSTHQSGTSAVIKVIYDDKNMKIEGHGVNSVGNNVIVAFWLGDDTHDSMTAAAPRLQALLAAMVLEGVKVGNITQKVKLCMGGDMKFQSSMMGLCGSSSTYPCMKCLCNKADLSLGAADFVERGELPPKLRSYEHQLQLSHTVMDSPYTCLACRKVISKDDQCLPLEGNESARLNFQKEHSGTRPGFDPKVLRMCVCLSNYIICDHVCVYVWRRLSLAYVFLCVCMYV